MTFFYEIKNVRRKNLPFGSHLGSNSTKILRVILKIRGSLDFLWTSLVGDQIIRIKIMSQGQDENKSHWSKMWFIYSLWYHIFWIFSVSFKTKMFYFIRAYFLLIPKKSYPIRSDHIFKGYLLELTIFRHKNDSQWATFDACHFLSYKREANSASKMAFLAFFDKMVLWFNQWLLVVYQNFIWLQFHISTWSITFITSIFKYIS